MSEYISYLWCFHRRIKKNFAVIILQLIAVVIIQLVLPTITQPVGPYLRDYLTDQLYFGITYTIIKMIFNARVKFDDFYEPFSNAYVWIAPAIYYVILFFTVRLLIIKFNFNVFSNSYASIMDIFNIINNIMYTFLGFYVYFGLIRLKEIFTNVKTEQYKKLFSFFIAVSLILFVLHNLLNVGDFVSPTHRNEFSFSLFEGVLYYVFYSYTMVIIVPYSLAYIFLNEKIKNLFVISQ